MPEISTCLKVSFEKAHKMDNVQNKSCSSSYTATLPQKCDYNPLLTCYLLSRLHLDLSQCYNGHMNVKKDQFQLRVICISL